MQLSKLDFGALLSYSPRGDSAEIQKSKRIMTALKSDESIKAGTLGTTISQWVAETIDQSSVTHNTLSLEQEGNAHDL